MISWTSELLTHCCSTQHQQSMNQADQSGLQIITHREGLKPQERTEVSHLAQKSQLLTENLQKKIRTGIILLSSCGQNPRPLIQAKCIIN